MLSAARLCRFPVTSLVAGTLKSTPKTCKIVTKPLNCTCLVTRSENYASQARTRIGFGKKMAPTKSKTSSLKEAIMAPAGDSAFTLGRGLVAGASVIGIGALCYYGLGLSNEVGALDRSALWPEEVKQRIKSTYMYFGGGLAVTAVSALAIARSPAMMNMMMKNSWLAIGATFAAMIGSGMIARSIPYKEGFGAKQVAWMVHAGIMGAVVAPLTLLGGPLLVRAAWYTAGIVGGLSTVAVCAPSEKFLNMGGPLAVGLGLVFASSIGGMFLPPTTALGAGLYSISIYGGLVLFGMFLLYDTQRIIKKAETYPVYGMAPYDPVNESISIYLDTLNIFIRLAMILAGGGGRRK
ncbi:growth hormone-inducible transmembrane protein-like [Lineus longissimus]|uniref:growth hormone-inducible transmembrane protein-like n=1 Tax=Lineus longissimus TaxID=88925 RepID=UPI002B4F7870